ncbi:MAG: DUF2924 domain-containing protein [Candidatus Hodarchaeota archaeon]
MEMETGRNLSAVNFHMLADKIPLREVFMEKRKRRKIVRELPPIGTKLTGKFKEVRYSAKIVADKTTSSGKAVEYSGVRYQSMTAAAKAITRQSTNGWRFWKIDKQ